MAEIVTLPTHVGSIQQVDNGRIIQAADISTVGRVAAGGSSYQRQAVRNGRTKYRAKIVATERERVAQRVIVSQVEAIKVAERSRAIGGKKAIHSSMIPFTMNGWPAMIDIC